LTEKVKKYIPKPNTESDIAADCPIYLLAKRENIILPD
jgi:hypothetical protein